MYKVEVNMAESLRMHWGLVSFKYSVCGCESLSRSLHFLDNCFFIIQECFSFIEKWFCHCSQQPVCVAALSLTFSFHLQYCEEEVDAVEGAQLRPCFSLQAVHDVQGVSSTMIQHGSHDSIGLWSSLLVSGSQPSSLVCCLCVSRDWAGSLLSQLRVPTVSAVT